MWAPLPDGRGAFWVFVTGDLMEMLDFARLQPQLRRPTIWLEESMIRVASTSTKTASPEKDGEKGSVLRRGLPHRRRVRKTRPLVGVPSMQMNPKFPSEACLTKKNNITGFDSPANAGSTVTFGVFKVVLLVMGGTLSRNSISF